MGRGLKGEEETRRRICLTERDAPAIFPLNRSFSFSFFFFLAQKDVSLLFGVVSLLSPCFCYSRKHISVYR